MKILITGFPGTGKTTITAELQRRGYNALDLETIPGFMYTVSRVDGSPIKKPAAVPTGWYDTVGAFIWDPQKIVDLLASNQDVIVCSKAHNQDDYLELFDRIFVLTTDSGTLTERLATRPGKNIGQTPEELYDILRLHRGFEQRLIAAGALPINTSHTLNETADTIVHHLDTTRAGMQPLRTHSAM